MARPGKPRHIVRRTVIAVILCGVTFWALFPFYWALTTSLKPKQEVFTISYLSIPFLQYRPTLDNWREELAVPGTQKIIWTSVVVATGSALLAVFLGCLAGYALARFRFGRIHSKDITLWFLGQNILPGVVLVVPFFLLMKAAHLLDSRIALMLANSTFTIPFVTIVMRAMFKELPEELEEAALVDGYTRYGAFRKIVLPLAAPAITAVSFIAFAQAWNEFLFALTLSYRDAITIPVWIAGSESTRGVQFWFIATRALVALTPPTILVLLGQRFIVRGLTFGALKG
jgi:multiple sugar transport system permease protein